MEGFDKSDFWFYYGPDAYHVQEGTGDNLLEEDIRDGYVDYIYYGVYETDDPNYIPNDDDDELDGGMCLLEKLYKDYSVVELITHTLNMFAYPSFTAERVGEMLKDGEIKILKGE